LKSAYGGCYNCGGNHFIKDCKDYSKNKSSGKDLYVDLMGEEVTVVKIESGDEEMKKELKEERKMEGKIQIMETILSSDDEDVLSVS
jgi:hypothetical protein